MSSSLPISDSDTPAYWRDVRLFILTFSMWIALTFLVVYILARRELDTPIFPLIQVFSLFLIVLGAPTVYHVISRRLKWQHHPSWMNQDGIISTVVLFILVIMGKIQPILRFDFYPVAGIISVIIFIVVLIELYDFKTPVWHIQMAVYAIVLGIFIAGGVWGKSVYYGGTYTNPLFTERLIASSSSIDTLFHAGVANLIVTYGLPSTGLHGLPYLHYHYGSHWIFSGLAQLIGISILDFYQILHVIFYPLFFSTLLLVGARFRVWFGLPQIYISSEWRIWAFLPIALITLFPHILQWHYGVLWDRYVSSESYVLSLIALFVTLDMILGVISKIDFQNVHIPRREVIAILIVLPLLASVMGFLKISTAFVFMSAYGYGFLRLRLYRYAPVLFGFLIACTLVFIVYRTVEGQGFVQFELFSYINEYVGWFNIPIWLFIYLFFTIVYIALRVYQMRLTHLTHLKVAILSRQMMDIEILIIIVLAGAFPGMILNMPYWSAGYFSDIQHWVAIAMLLGFVSVISWRALFPPKTFFRRFARIMIVLAIIGALAINYFAVVLGAIHLNRQNHDQIAESSNSHQAIFNVLQQLSQLPTHQKYKTLLYIPKENTLYWDWLKCNATPFIATAVSGMAMVEHLPISSCEVKGIGYTYNTYKGYQNPQNMTNSGLCQTVVSLGFANVIRIDRIDNTLIAEQIQCDRMDYPSKIIINHTVDP